MAGSKTEKSTIPEGKKNPLDGLSYNQPQPRPPIDTLIPNTVREPQPEPASESGTRPEQKPEAKQKPEPGADTGKGKVTVLVPTDLLERLRNAAWWQRKTLATLAEDGIRQVVEKLERQNGGPFERRGQDKLQTGRPQKSSTAKGR